MSLSENIYRLRTEKNMSQLDLADALEVSRQSVSKWETGTAVPELDKLVKMAKLFEISLDELVNGEAFPTREAPAPSEAPEPRVIYVEKPVFPAVKQQYIIGSAILFCALIYGLILYNGRYDMVVNLLLVLPVLACGLVYLFTERPLIWCGWFGACAYWIHFLLLFHRWEEHPFLILLGVTIVSFMFLRTVLLRKRGVLRIPFGFMLLLSIALFLLFVLLCVNCISFSLFTNEVSTIPMPK